MPVTLNIVTGLLGSGKTCVLQHLLLDEMPIEKPAVVVGEFAEEGLDGRLLERDGIPVRQLTSSGVGEAAKSFVDPVRELVFSNQHNRVYLETSGVAEIHRIVGDILKDEELLRRLVFGHTVTVIDAGGFELHRTHFAEQFWNQVDVADVLVLNKVDRVTREEEARVTQELKARNPQAEVTRSYMGQIRRGLVNRPLDPEFTPRILTGAVHAHQVAEFEAFMYRTRVVCYDRVMFGHRLLNIPYAKIARFKGRLRAYDKTHCVNGFPGQLDWDNTPVEGDTSIALIGLELMANKAAIVGMLDEELERQRLELMNS
jgi:G3E family GTPase